MAAPVGNIHSKNESDHPLAGRPRSGTKWSRDEGTAQKEKKEKKGKKGRGSSWGPDAEDDNDDELDFSGTGTGGAASASSKKGAKKSANTPATAVSMTLAAHAAPLLCIGK